MLRVRDQKLSGEELARRSLAAQAAFGRAGLSAGDRILLLLLERDWSPPGMVLLIAILLASIPFLVVLGQDRYHLPLVAFACITAVLVLQLASAAT